MTDEGQESAGETQQEAGETRRSMLKKTAVAPIVAGAVWAAPKIEGLSLVPDMAAAASGGTLNQFTGIGLGQAQPLPTTPSGGVTVSINFNGVPGNLELTQDLPSNCVFQSVNAFIAVDGDGGATFGVPTGTGTAAVSYPVNAWSGDFDFGLVSFDMTCT